MIGFHQFVEDLLCNILGVGGIGHTPAYKIAQRAPSSATISEIGRLCPLIPMTLAGSSIHLYRRMEAGNIVEIWKRFDRLLPCS